jgi:hypothetical protein
MLKFLVFVQENYAFRKSSPYQIDLHVSRDDLDKKKRHQKKLEKKKKPFYQIPELLTMSRRHHG